MGERSKLHGEVDMLADNLWQEWADGYLSCPVCGSLVHPLDRDTHRKWHPFTERYKFQSKV